MTLQQWRHKKRGSVYEVLTDNASLQCASAPEFEQRFDRWTVYRDVLTGAMYLRPTPEFKDGRFELIDREPQA